MNTLLTTWIILSIIPTIFLICFTFKDLEKQWEFLKLWFYIEISLFFILIPIALIVLLFNFLET